ncbi:hypothetical protein FRC06_009861, partial [Ceratobasidium sp. 370]
MSKVQKFGLLMNPETQEAFEKVLEEEQAKQAMDVEKVANKEGKMKEIEGKRSHIIADLTYMFDGTLQSYKLKNLEQLSNLAACFRVPFADSKCSDIFNRITVHFEAHPELKSLSWYSSMFSVTCVSQQV